MSSSSRRRLAAVPSPDRNRAVAYRRVSAVMGREELHSPELQLRAIRDLIGRRGLVEVDVVSDIDATGRHFQREGIQRVLGMARAGQIDVVVVYDLSRVGRNTGESLRVISELRELGVSVASTVERIDDSPEGQFVLAQFLSLAQLYSDQIGRRWQEVARYRAERGLQWGSVPPLGYRRAEGGGIEPDPELGPAMADAFGSYAAGQSMAEIGRRFNHWTPAQRTTALVVLKKALRNPVYIGQVRLNGQTYPGAHEPLVDQATWDRVQARADQDARTPARRLSVAYATTGLLVCAHCGYNLRHHGGYHSSGSGRGDTARVECARARDFRDCPAGGIGAPPVRDIEAALLAWVRGLLTGPVDTASRDARKARARSDVKRLKRELTETRDARARLAADFARRIVDERAFLAADRELAQAEQKLVEAVAVTDEDARAPGGRRQVSAARWLLGEWDGLTPGERNRALRLLLSRVEIRRADYYREPVADRIRPLQH